MNGNLKLNYEILARLFCPPCVFSCVWWQDSLDELEMDDFWKEVENISRSGGEAARGEAGGEGDVQEEEQPKAPEGRTRRAETQFSFCYCV